MFDLYGHFGNGHHTFCSCCVLIVCCICVCWTGGIVLRNTSLVHVYCFTYCMYTSTIVWSLDLHRMHVDRSQTNSFHAELDWRLYIAPQEWKFGKCFKYLIIYLQMKITESVRLYQRYQARLYMKDEHQS